MVGGVAWNRLPNMINDLYSEVREEVLNLASLYLQIYYGEDVAYWVVHNWKYLDEFILPVVRTLKNKTS